MENLTIAQLKETLTQKGIEFKSKMKKEELVKLLHDSEKPAKKGKSFRGEY